LINGTEGGEQVHESALAAEDADGQAAADDFAERDQVCIEAVEFERSAEGNAEAGHDLIDDEQGAFAEGERAQGGEVARSGRDAAGVADDGLDDDSGDGTGVGVKGGFDGGDVVVRQGVGEMGDLLGTPAEPGMPKVATPEPALTSRPSEWP